VARRAKTLLHRLPGFVPLRSTKHEAFERRWKKSVRRATATPPERNARSQLSAKQEAFDECKAFVEHWKKSGK
jgi:hypothetical protein